MSKFRFRKYMKIKNNCRIGMQFVQNDLSKSVILRRKTKNS